MHLSNAFKQCLAKQEGFDMADKNLGISNMNGDTNNEDKSCALNDMNCNAQDNTSHGLNNMNGATHNEDKTCALNDMNCTE